MRPHQPGSAAVVMLIAFAAGGLAGCGGGGSSADVTAESLKPRLLPLSALPVPGFREQRTFDWSDPIDLVGQGIWLPEVTQPSSG